MGLVVCFGSGSTMLENKNLSWRQNISWVQPGWHQNTVDHNSNQVELNQVGAKTRL